MKGANKLLLLKEDYEGLLKAIAILQTICKNAVMSEIEEEQERQAEKILKFLKNERVFELILLKRRKQIPMKFREIINEQWLKDHTRIRTNGLYEIRCSINKIPITGSGKSIETACENFINSLIDKTRPTPKKPDKKPEVKRVLFNDFAEQWVSLVKKPTVKECTYTSFVINYNAHVKPFFNGKYIDDITAMQIQPLFNGFAERKQSRVAQNIKVILNQIFEGAVAERLITFNPMANVKVLKHHNKRGTALSYEEEAEFLRKLNDSKYKLTFAIMLFGGMRRGELASLKVEGEFLSVKNGKLRISQEETRRRIPITPMLRPYLENATAEELCEAVSLTCDKLSRAFKALCPLHHLHELRHTFVTRCQECGVPREVVSVWAGHASDNTMTSTVYTHFSPEFMLHEGQKIDYYNRLKD